VWHRHSQGWIYPRIEHLYNLNRSLKIFSQMQELDVPAIPHVYWGRPDDLDLWATWLGDNPCVTMFAIDLQTVDSPKSWNSALRALRYLRANLPRPVHLFASGICQIQRVAELRQVWPDSTLCNTGAYFTSGFGRFKDRFGLVRPWAPNPADWSRTDIFEKIVRQYMTVEPLGLGVANAHAAKNDPSQLPIALTVTPPVPSRSQPSAAPFRLVQLRLWDNAESVA
jgi:hypothetical protein